MRQNDFRNHVYKLSDIIYRHVNITITVCSAGSAGSAGSADSADSAGSADSADSADFDLNFYLTFFNLGFLFLLFGILIFALMM